MKLGLLVLAVAVAVVLVPCLSEGRVVSKCELKNKLWKRIAVQKFFSKTLKEHLLAVVICELDRMSSLNTSIVNVKGERGPKETTAEEMIAEEVPAEETSSEEVPAEETSSEEVPADEVLAEETSAEEVPADEVLAEETSAEEFPADEVLAEEMSAENMTLGTTTEATTTEAMNSKTTTEPTKKNLQAGKSRPKRMVEIFNEEHIWTPSELKIEEMVNFLKSNCDEEEIGWIENKMDEEDRDSNAEDDEENDKPWSLGNYGVFQLSDGYYCSSGHRWSKNKCKKSCSDFTDDDITDDIDCFLKIGCWKKIYQARTLQCSRIRNYFDECK